MHNLDTSRGVIKVSLKPFKISRSSNRWGMSKWKWGFKKVKLFNIVKLLENCALKYDGDLTISTLKSIDCENFWKNSIYGWWRSIFPIWIRVTIGITSKSYPISDRWRYGNISSRQIIRGIPWGGRPWRWRIRWRGRIRWSTGRIRLIFIINFRIIMFLFFICLCRLS